MEIPQGVTLTIKPGTSIRFTAQSDDRHGEEEYSPEDPSTIHATMISILVCGVLDAQGTPDQPIVFMSDSLGPLDGTYDAVEEGEHSNEWPSSHNLRKESGICQ